MHPDLGAYACVCYTYMREYNMRINIRHSIRTLATTLLLLVVSAIIYAQQPAGITADKATRITAPVTLSVQSGGNFIRFDATHLPAVVAYIPSAPFGTIPVALVMGDTIAAEMIFTNCGISWQWTIAEAENDQIVEIKAHENALINVAPHTCDNTYSEDTQTACDSLLWNGKWYNESGDYEYVTTNAAGCDSIVTLHLTINHSVQLNMRGIDVCGSYLWGDTLIETSGTYTRRLHTISGCDSIVTQTITVHQAISLTLPDTAVCETDFGYEYVWSDPVMGDTTITQNGTYTRRLKTQYRCDSIVTQTVRFLDMTYGSAKVTAYDSYTTNMGMTYTKSVAGAIDYYTNAAGCDSVVTLDLRIRHLQVNDTFPQTICATELPFQWYGKSYMESGIYTTDTIEGVAVNGVYMDTVHTVNLIVLPTSAGDTAAAVCESFVWYGETYSASGEYNHTLTNVVGCDSVVTLHLTIYHATTGDTSAVACNAYDWYGKTYTESGEYNHTLEGGNSHGCDSVITLHLTIHTPTTGEETKEACSSYEWHGTTYTTSGDYTFTTANVAGCDSTVTLHLTILQPTTGEEMQEACMSYTWKEHTYTVSGDYTYTTVNAAGCDSVVTLHLTILDNCATFDTVCFCRGLNTEHEEKIAEDRIRRYIPYSYESPAEWDYMDGVMVRGEANRTLMDLHRAETNLYAHYVKELEPISAITWSFRPKNATAYQIIEAGTQAQWIEAGVIAVQVQFLCGHVYRSDLTTDTEMVNAESSEEGKKMLKDGQIIILRNGKMYNIFGMEISGLVD